MSEEHLTTRQKHELQEIADAAKQADRPLHPNEARVDWVHYLGGREKAYVESLRNALKECSNKIAEMIAEQQG